MASDDVSPELNAQSIHQSTRIEQTKTPSDTPNLLRKDALDEGEDVTAPKTKRGRIMNQSFISMIASVGLSSNFNATFAPVAEEDGKPRPISPVQPRSPERKPKDALYKVSSESTIRSGASDIRKIASERKMLQSTSALHSPVTRKKRRKPSLGDLMTTSQILPPSPQTNPAMSSRAPLVSPISSRQPAQETPHSESHIVEEETTNISNVEADMDAVSPTEAPKQTLAEQLASMFGFETIENVVAEYRCCLLQDVPVQGYLYILQKHICFYAYLPKETTAVTKSGYLLKRGRQNPKYNRYWFSLKGNVLYYYMSREEQYFPRGTIELHSGLSTRLDPSPQEKAHTSFSISSRQSTYHFKTDTVSSGQDWVDKIRKAAFRSEHSGESVKIAFPIDNILEIEDSQMTEGADMIKIKVIDNDETFVVDEHFFSLFGQGREAIQTLRRSLDKRSVTDSTGDVDADGLPLEEISLDEQDDEPLPAQDSSNLDGSNRLGTSQNTLTSSSSSPALYSKITGKAIGPSGLFSPSLSILRPAESFSSMQELYKAGTDRLRQATHVASNLRSQSLRVGIMLARESKGYYERVYSMWAGKKTHYDDNEGPMYEQGTDAEGDRQGGTPGDRFRDHFALNKSEKLQATYYSYFHRVVPIYGKIYVGSTKLCFRSLMPGTRTKMILPFRDVENVAQEKGFRFGHYGLVIVIRGHEELFFEFRESVGRDDCALTLLQIIDSVKQLQDSRMLNQEEKQNIAAAKQEHELLQQARRNSLDNEFSRISSNASGSESVSDTIIFDDTFASIVDFKPTKSLKIVCLTIGSRGDVQPYIALCKGLIAEGHRPVIATHGEFESWIRSHGIEFRLVAGEPARIMQLCVENDMFTVSFLREAQRFRGFIDDLLLTSWQACQDADVLIESPSAMGGIHIAEALEIPYFRAFTMPWTRTRAYPHAFAVMNQKMGGNWNWYSYVLFEVGFWQGIAGQVNSWRGKVLGLPPTSLKKQKAEKVPFLYNFSPSVVAPPLDFGHQIHITGYWFLDEGKDYEPPQDLLDFMQKARDDGKKLVYVGFGSVTVEDPAALTRAVSEAVLDADVRCVLSKGWSDRMDKADASVPEIPLHESIFQIPGAPHDWLFTQVDAAAHHGGAGTTGASLRAGIPTIVKPFFGDQHFFAARVEDLGVGRCLKIINSRTLAKALLEATKNERIISRAKALGEQIRSEDGVQTAIQNIYRDLEYARSLIKPRGKLGDIKHIDEAPVEESEEGWTLVDDDEEGEEEVFAATGDTRGPEFQSTLLQMQGRSGTGRDRATSISESSTEF